MRRTRWPSELAVASALMLLAAACANSENDAGRPPTTRSSGAGVATQGRGALVKVDAPGVTDTEIRVGGVASVQNPLGGKYGDAFMGVKAYFDQVNQAGGIHGRSLVLASERDDKTANNKAEVQGLLTEDDVFAVLPVATLLFTGAQALVDAGVPTYGWTINPEWQGSASDPRSNLFGQAGSFLCFDCPRPNWTWLAKEINAKKVGVLAYSVAQSSACGEGVRASFAKYGEAAGAEVAFVDKSLAFGSPDFSVQVSRMKRAGVDLITPCIDANGIVTLAKELKKQDLDAVMSLPNAYDHDFVEEFGDLFEGSYVRTDFVQWEVEDKPEGLQRYLEAMDEAGVEPSENSLVGWLNADLFATGLREAGPRFDRQKVIDATNRLTDYDAGGVLSGVDWTKLHTQRASDTEECQFLSKIEDSEFVPVFTKPGKPFLCTVYEDGELVARYES